MSDPYMNALDCIAKQKARIKELETEIQELKKALLTITRIHPPSVAVREAQIVAREFLGKGDKR